MAAIARIPYVTSHSLQHQPKNGNCRDERYISWYECSWQVDTTIGPNSILYFYCVEILVIWNTIREFVTETLIQLWWNTATLDCFTSHVGEHRTVRGLWKKQGIPCFLYARLKNGTYYAVAMSVRLSVRPSVRPSAFSGLFFNMLWDINLKLGIYIQ